MRFLHPIPPQGEVDHNRSTLFALFEESGCGRKDRTFIFDFKQEWKLSFYLNSFEIQIT